MHCHHRYTVHYNIAKVVCEELLRFVVVSDDCVAILCPQTYADGTNEFGLLEGIVLKRPHSNILVVMLIGKYDLQRWETPCVDP